MASGDTKAAGRLEETPPPPGEEPPLAPNEASAPVDFSELTPSQFGISAQSFTPALASNHKDKSRLAQIKNRRRSTIGVRGSPETNSLIRFMAQQRMKTPPTSQTPELVRSSPCFPRVPSTLRQKMASFQVLMDVEESDACDPKPARDGSTGGCITTRDYLSDGSSEGKENNPPATPTPSKRRRLVGPLEGCSEEIREAGTPILLSSLKEQEVNTEPGMPGGRRLCKVSVGETEAVLGSQNLHAHFELNAKSPPRKQQGGVFEVQSPRRPPPVDPAAASPPRRSSPFHVPSLPPLLEGGPTEEEKTPVMKRKKKQVRFGGPLSPELFDKTLPPSTPLQRGGTPARAPTPGGGVQLRSLLKTPQGSEMSQPDLGSPTWFGASPTLSIPRRGRRESEIVSPSAEEVDSALTNETEYTWDTRPLNLNNAFQEESLSETLTAETSEPEATICQMEKLDEPASCPQENQQPEAGVEDPAPKHRGKRSKKGRSEQEADAEAPARSGSRKRKQPEESEPVKRSTRSAAKSASGKMKQVSAAPARRWSKDVDLSLYGSRAFASKNPNLSPITERLSLSGPSPAAQQQAPSVHHAATNQDSLPNPETPADALTGVVTVTSGIETATEDLFTSSSEDAAGRLLELKVSEEAQGKEGNCEDQTTISLDAALGDLSTRDAPTQGDAEKLCTPSADSESHVKRPTPKKARRGRRSPASVSVLQELQNQAGGRQAGREVGRGPAEPAASQQENVRSGSASGELLAPWQADFNFEDVFKPVATRGQRSVRRSLRNRGDGELGGDGAGLAWLPRTSPESLKEARRRTRGRRPGEETQDAS